MSYGYVSENLAQKTKKILIQELRYYFQNISQFGFPGNPIKMPIIREAFGLTVRQYPIIVIKILHEETKNLGIGRDFVQDVFSDDQLIGQEYLPGTENFTKPVKYKPRVVAERYGYMSDITFNLQVVCDTTPVRNRVVDECKAALRFYRRESMLNKGLQLMKISEGEETDFPLNQSQKVYISNINLIINAELYVDHTVASITKINPYGVRKVNLSPHTPEYIVQQDDTPLG